MANHRRKWRKHKKKTDRNRCCSAKIGKATIQWLWWANCIRAIARFIYIGVGKRPNFADKLPFFYISTTANDRNIIEYQLNLSITVHLTLIHNATCCSFYHIVSSFGCSLHEDKLSENKGMNNRWDIIRLQSLSNIAHH